MYSGDAQVSKVEVAELMPALLLAKLPENLDHFEFASTTFETYRKFFYSTANFNFTQHYINVLQHARPALLLRKGLQIVKAMALMTYIVLCLIVQPLETRVPEWHDLCAEFFTAFDKPDELLQLV